MGAEKKIRPPLRKNYSDSPAESMIRK